VKEQPDKKKSYRGPMKDTPAMAPQKYGVLMWLKFEFPLVEEKPRQ
jgi:hypothetical protein